MKKPGRSRADQSQIVSHSNWHKASILFAATLLCARKLIETIVSDRPDLAMPYFVDRTIEEAAFILDGIDKKWTEARFDSFASICPSSRAIV